MIVNKNRRAIGYKELSQEIKGLANELLQNFAFPATQLELTLLSALVSYMDTFILKCLDKDGNLKHTLWITARLMEHRILLGTSPRVEIQRIVTKIESLERLIHGGKKNGKRN